MDEKLGMITVALLEAKHSSVFTQAAVHMTLKSQSAA